MRVTTNQKCHMTTTEDCLNRNLTAPSDEFTKSKPHLTPMVGLGDSCYSRVVTPRPTEEEALRICFEVSRCPTHQSQVPPLRLFLSALAKEGEILFVCPKGGDPGIASKEATEKDRGCSTSFMSWPENHASYISHNVGIAIINHQLLLVYTTHLW